MTLPKVEAVRPCARSNCSTMARVGSLCDRHHGQAYDALHSRRLPFLRLSRSCIERLEAQAECEGRSIYLILTEILDAWQAGRR